MSPPTAETPWYKQFWPWFMLSLLLSGHMPAQAAYIGEERVHLVAAYVYSLSDDN